jgi:hypothetical protein
MAIQTAVVALNLFILAGMGCAAGLSLVAQFRGSRTPSLASVKDSE